MNIHNPTHTNISYLYRLLRQQDEPLRGLHSTNPSAYISIRQHVQRRRHDARISSQFISTTRDPTVVLQWLFQEGRNGHHGRLVIISCGQLDVDIMLHDLSRGHPDLTKYYNDLVIRHQEILVTPSVNSSAIIGSLSYLDLSANGRGWGDFKRLGLREINNMVSEDQPSFQQWLATEEVVERFYSLRCSFCSEPGHEDEGCFKLFLLLQ
ncbi:MAG: hypothetical protein JOS17DRAFT_738800 [Linnemannia elongata]|nr:MAG: hypothetical protein JOS17DRAFT_738800 [Linnemannia elongata]